LDDGDGDGDQVGVGLGVGAGVGGAVCPEQPASVTHRAAAATMDSWCFEIVKA
jgi:hypothetical protein